MSDSQKRKHRARQAERERKALEQRGAHWAVQAHVTCLRALGRDAVAHGTTIVEVRTKASNA